MWIPLHERIKIIVTLRRFRAAIFTWESENEAKNSKRFQEIISRKGGLIAIITDQIYFPEMTQIEGGY